MKLHLMGKGLVLAIAGTLFITACGAPAPTQHTVGEGHVYARGSATITLVPQVKAGGYRAQALVSAYTKASINHMLVKVYQVSGEVELPVLDANNNQVMADLSNGELDFPLTFSNLFRRTTYRIRCFAYKAPGDAAADLISTTDANSYTDVKVLDDDRPAMSALKVKLIDTIFNGENSAGIEVTDGGIIPNGPVTITKATPAPVPTPSPTPTPAPEIVRTVLFEDQTSAQYFLEFTANPSTSPGVNYRLEVNGDPFSGRYSFILYANDVPGDPVQSQWTTFEAITIAAPDGFGAVSLVPNGSAPWSTINASFTVN